MFFWLTVAFMFKVTTLRYQNAMKYDFCCKINILELLMSYICKSYLYCIAFYLSSEIKVEL